MKEGLPQASREVPPWLKEKKSHRRNSPGTLSRKCDDWVCYSFSTGRQAEGTNELTGVDVCSACAERSALSLTDITSFLQVNTIPWPLGDMTRVPAHCAGWPLQSPAVCLCLPRHPALCLSLSLPSPPPRPPSPTAAFPSWTAEANAGGDWRGSPWLTGVTGLPIPAQRRSPCWP